MKIAGFHSGHECSYCIVEDGIPILHAELERYLRLKEPFGDGLELLFKDYADCENIKYFSHSLCTWKGGIRQRHPDTYKKMWSIITKNDGNFFAPGHHEGHAASAFFQSNLTESFIITIDGGGRDYLNNDVATVTIGFFYGENNKIETLGFLPDHIVNIGAFWSSMTRDVFGLSVGYPKGHQAGTVMAMAAFGEPKYYEEILSHNFLPWNFNFKKFTEIAIISEQDKFDVAASLQKATEIFIINIISNTINQLPKDIKCKNLCLSGGVALNSVMTGKLIEQIPFDNVYVDPVPYDGGLAIGCALYTYYHVLNNPRVFKEDNFVPYLGKQYLADSIISNYPISKVDNVEIKDIIDLLENQKIVAVFGGGSESGRRALGNRSILADPRSHDMKNKINEKVKHRQWFRPFAPSILREEVINWFARDVNSPYMSFVVKFKDDMKHLVPAVVHKDDTARLQTVTYKDNPWYYTLLKEWKIRTGVPILLNTSFNDREPIVETPDDAIKCYLNTEIDYLYFYDEEILVNRQIKI